jgi:lipid II:glycine glycyltransferase (peptidoglycan interpeptide bridge formation enzyme)
MENNHSEQTIPFVIKKKGKQVKYISLPFSDEVTLLHSKKINENIISGILQTSDNISIELRCKYEGDGFKNKLIGHKHLLDLTQETKIIFNTFKKTQVQQPIQKAIKEGLSGEVRIDFDAMTEFYKLHLITRKKLGIPIQPKRFFFHFFHEIIKNNLGFIVLVSIGKKVISAGIFAGANKTITYKFSASHPEYLTYRPNNLMLWTAILESKKRGFEVFDFGRTDLETEGLRKFKQGWGTIEEPLYYSYYPEIPDKTKFIFIKNNIVTPVIKHSPGFVCQWTGEVLYKYFG